jgi:hypothetical protein
MQTIQYLIFFRAGIVGNIFALNEFQTSNGTTKLTNIRAAAGSYLRFNIALLKPNRQSVTN